MLMSWAEITARYAQHFWETQQKNECLVGELRQKADLEKWVQPVTEGVKMTKVVEEEEMMREAELEWTAVIVNWRALFPLL